MTFKVGYLKIYVDECIHMNEDYQLETLTEILTALADPTRQEIIKIFFTRSELCANDIAGYFKLTRPTISHHLNLMRRLKILNSRKDGKEVYYSFNKDYVVKSVEGLLNLLKSCC